MNRIKSNHFTLEKVGEGIFAAIANEGTGAVANAGLIDLGDETLIFDTFNTQQAAEELKAAADLYCSSPITHVINSHWHGDHIRGNQVFKDKLIISSEQTYNKMKTTHPDRFLRQKNSIEELSEYIQSLIQEQINNFDSKRQQQINFLNEIKASLPGLELVLPSKTFVKDYHFYGTKRKAQLFTLGGGHTICDAMLYLPDDKLLFTGDILFVENHPSLFEESDANNWIEILQTIEKLDLEGGIPGHGPVGTLIDVTKQIDYLKRLLKLVKGTDPIEVIPMPADYNNWASPETFIQNLKILNN